MTLVDVVQQMMLTNDDGVPPKVGDVHLDVRWSSVPPLGEVPKDVQDARADVKLHDALLEVDVHSKVPTSDVVLLPDDVGVALMMFAIVLLVNDVDRVNGQDDADELNFSAVLDEQGDVEVSWCDLL